MTGPGRSRRVATVLAVAVAMTVAFGALVVWDGWFVNYDGSFYLALARNLRHGVGYVFPDGAPATFRGPGYPGVLALAWLVLPETARSAVWVTRLVLVLDAGLLVVLVRRWGGSPGAALVAGVLVAVQPAVLVSGAAFLVPDGVAAGFVLTAFLLVGGRRPATARLLAVGAVLGAGFLVKESALPALVLPVAWVAGTAGVRAAARAVGPLLAGWGLVTWPWFVFLLQAGGGGWPSPSFLLAVAAVAGVVLAGWRLGGGGAARLGARATRLLLAGGVFLLVFAALRVAGGVPIVGVGELWSALRADLATQLYRGSPWGLLLPALLLAVGWGVDRVAEDGAFGGVLLVAYGAAFLLYGVSVGAAVRNAVLLVYGLGALTGLAVAGWWRLGGDRVVAQTVAVAVVAATLWGSVAAGTALEERIPERALTAEGPAATAAAAWLAGHARGDAVAGTPLYLQSLWRLSAGAFRPRLVPVFVAPPAGRLGFSRRLDWAATTAGSPAAGDRPVLVTVTRTQRAGFFAASLVTTLEEGRADLLVVTGNLDFPTSAYDGGGLLPFLEASPDARAVFRAGPAPGRPQWIVVYALDRPFRAGEAPPVVHLATAAEVPRLAPGQVVLDDAGYRELVRGVLGRIPAGGDPAR